MNKEKDIFTVEDLLKARVFQYSIFEYVATNMMPVFFYVTNFYQALRDEFAPEVADALFYEIHGKTFMEKYNECKAYDLNAWRLGQERQKEAEEQLDKLRKE